MPHPSGSYGLVSHHSTGMSLLCPCWGWKDIPQPCGLKLNLSSAAAAEATKAELFPEHFWLKKKSISHLIITAVLLCSMTILFIFLNVMFGQLIDLNAGIVIFLPIGSLAGPISLAQKKLCAQAQCSQDRKPYKSKALCAHCT